MITYELNGNTVQFDSMYSSILSTKSNTIANKRSSFLATFSILYQVNQSPSISHVQSADETAVMGAEGILSKVSLLRTY